MVRRMKLEDNMTACARVRCGEQVDWKHSCLDVDTILSGLLG